MKYFKKVCSIFIFCIIYAQSLLSAATAGKKLDVKKGAEILRKEDAAKLQKIEFGEPLENFASHGLIILLAEPKDDKIDAIKETLKLALAQKACPILVSFNLLANLFRIEQGEIDKKLLDESYHDFQELVVEALNAWEKSADLKKPKEQADFIKHINEEKSLITLSNEIAQNRLILKALTFKPEEWIIKTNYDALLLIPRNYLPILKDYKPSTGKLDDTQPLTKTELALGLKIDHLMPYQIDVLRQKKEYDPSFALSETFVNKLFQDFFIQRREYTANKIAINKMPHWVIYLSGHGTVGASIADLPLTEFKSLLTLLDLKIVTRLFVYSSCYAVGTNFNLVYKDLKGASQKDITYSFIIATEGISDQMVYRNIIDIGIDFKINDIDFINKKLILDRDIFVNRFTVKGANLNFSKFFKEATDTPINAINYSKLLSNVLQARKEVTELSELPMIRFPGLEWFGALKGYSPVVSIGSVLAQTQTKPLIVSSFAKKYGIDDLRGILLYTSFIPFEIILDMDRILQFISMVPGDTAHIIKSITDKTWEWNEILEGFTKNKQISRKIFWIKTLNFSEQEINVKPAYNKPTSQLKDVIIDMQQKEIMVTGQDGKQTKKEITHQIYFTLHNQKYLQNSYEEVPSIIKEDYIDQYEPMIEKIIKMSPKEFEAIRTTIQNIPSLLQKKKIEPVSKLEKEAWAKEKEKKKKFSKFKTQLQKAAQSELEFEQRQRKKDKK